MLSCTEEGTCVGVGSLMFWQILSSYSLYVWFLGFEPMYEIHIYNISIYIIYNILYIYIYITSWTSMFNNV